MGKLDAVASLRTARLTTIGRKSGSERIAEVWFVVDGDSILVQAGPKGQKGWYLNVRANPRVEVDLGGISYDGRAEILAAADDQERTARLVRDKYWLARVARWLGSQIGRGKPVRIHLAEPSG